MKKIFLLSIAVLLFAGMSFAQLVDHGNLRVNVVDEAWIQVNTTPTNLTTSINNNFQSYTGTTNISYKMRTTVGTGGGTITVAVADFVGAAGHSGPLPANLTFQGTDPAPAASAPAGVGNNAAQTVFTYGPDFHSANGGNLADIAWTLQNLPSYQTDVYTAHATFTISTT